jgi:flavin reductase (DIM6/NTAB) family NADH-FMN oxidoreductase RutF
MSDEPPVLAPIDGALFRQTMSHYASGVTVVTVLDGEGKPWALTANAISSVSLNPPLILVCIDKKANTYEALTRASYFAVNFLEAREEELALHFARHITDKFTTVPYEVGATGAPLLPQASIAMIECRMYAQYPGGDHTIVVGEVLAAKVSEGRPQIFYDRLFGTFVPNPSKKSVPAAEPDPWALDYF